MANATGEICFQDNAIHTEGLYGLWHGNSLLDYSFNLLLFQLAVISSISCSLYIILKPLGLPATVNQMIAGMVLGRSFLSQIPEFWDAVYPTTGNMVIETFGWFGFTFHMFLMGVRMDKSMVFTSEKRTKIISIGVLGLFGPILFGAVAAAYSKSGPITTNMLWIVYRTQSASYSAVISPFLRDLNILNSQLGRLATSSSVVSDVCYVIMVAISKYPFYKKGVTNIAGNIATTFFFWTGATSCMGAASRWVIKRTPRGQPVKEGYVNSFILALLGFSFFAMATGQGYIIAPFALGLAIPDGPPLGSAIEKRLSSFVSLVMIPVFFALCSKRAQLLCFDNMSWYVSLIIVVIFIAKLVIVMAISIYFKLPIRDAFILGLIMNNKGIVQLAVYKQSVRENDISSDVFGSLILSSLLIAIVVSCLVKWLYNPARRYEPHRRRTIQHAKSNTELGILTCVHSQDNVPNIIQMLDVSTPLNICVVHLVELEGRASSFLIQHKRQEKASSRFTQSEDIVKAFRCYEEMKQGLVGVEIFTGISPSAAWHDDVCSLALDQKSSLIILPFHKQWVVEGSVDSSIAVRNLNCNILERAPCSVGILISHTHLSSSQYMQPRKQQMFRVCVLFIGGADDREAVSYGLRMVEHHNVELTVIHITSKRVEDEDEKASILDSEILNVKSKTITNDRVCLKEETVENGEGVMTIIRSLENMYDLVMVGRRHIESSVTRGLTEWTEHPELGIIGDILATYEYVGVPLILVVQLGS